MYSKDSSAFLVLKNASIYTIVFHHGEFRADDLLLETQGLVQAPLITVTLRRVLSFSSLWFFHLLMEIRNQFCVMGLL